jgi:hypothetical protein
MDDLRRYEEAGLDTMIISVTGNSTDQTVDLLRHFAQDLVPKL